MRIAAATRIQITYVPVDIGQIIVDLSSHVILASIIVGLDIALRNLTPVITKYRDIEEKILAQNTKSIYPAASHSFVAKRKP
jgi:hypothetical protein